MNTRLRFWCVCLYKDFGEGCGVGGSCGVFEAWLWLGFLFAKWVYLWGWWISATKMFDEMIERGVVWEITVHIFNN